jgi:hypothetical protein
MHGLTNFKQDYSKINLSQCHCTLQTLHGLAFDLREIPATNHLHHDTAISYDPLLQKSVQHTNEAGTAQLIKWLAKIQCLIAIVGRDFSVFHHTETSSLPHLDC